VVLGLREVLDDPAVVAREWRRERTVESIHEHYDAVWVYGDPRVYDPVAQYEGLGDVAGLVRQTGYLDRRNGVGRSLSSESEDKLIANLELPSGGLALCLVGGGEDGARLAGDFARAALPPRTTGVVVTGPFMPAQERQALHRLAAENRRLRIVEFLEEPARLIDLADSVVAMGGYNTVCDAPARTTARCSARWPTSTAPGRSSTAPGRSSAAPGRSSAAPGRSSAAPRPGSRLVGAGLEHEPTVAGRRDHGAAARPARRGLTGDPARAAGAGGRGRSVMSDLRS